MLAVDGAAKAVLAVPAEGDHVAVIGENRKLLVFPLDQVPELARGKGVRLQRYRDGSISDVKVFTLKEGLSWKDRPAGAFRARRRAAGMARRPGRDRPFAAARVPEDQPVRALKRGLLEEVGDTRPFGKARQAPSPVRERVGVRGEKDQNRAPPSTRVRVAPYRMSSRPSPCSSPARERRPASHPANGRTHTQIERERAKGQNAAAKWHRDQEKELNCRLMGKGSAVRAACPMGGPVYDPANERSGQRRRERAPRHHERSEVTQGSATTVSAVPTELLRSAR